MNLNTAANQGLIIKGTINSEKCNFELEFHLTQQRTSTL
jgi:hypothetical protein